MLLSCYVHSQIIPKSRIVHLADKQILKRHILSYPKIIVFKIPPPPHSHGGGGGGFDTWPMDYQFMITPPSTSLIFSKNTTLLAFSDQHLDLSLMFPGPGIPRQSGTASEPSDMSFPPSGMSSPRASRRRTPISLSDLC